VGREGLLDGVDLVDGVVTNTFEHTRIGLRTDLAGARGRTSSPQVDVDLYRANPIDG